MMPVRGGIGCQVNGRQCFCQTLTNGQAPNQSDLRVPAFRRDIDGTPSLFDELFRQDLVSREVGERIRFLYKSFVSIS